MIVQTVEILCPECKKDYDLGLCRMERSKAKDVFEIFCPSCCTFLGRQTTIRMPRTVIIAYEFGACANIRTTYSLPTIV